LGEKQIGQTLREAGEMRIGLVYLGERKMSRVFLRTSKTNSQSTHFTPNQPFFSFFIMGIRGIIGQHDLPESPLMGRSGRKEKKESKGEKRHESSSLALIFRDLALANFNYCLSPTFLPLISLPVLNRERPLYRREDGEGSL
jgi:hypothetical protein